MPHLFYLDGNAGRYHTSVLSPKSVKRDKAKKPMFREWHGMVDFDELFLPEGNHKRVKSSSPRRLSRRNAVTRLGPAGFHYQGVDTPLPGLQRRCFCRHEKIWNINI